MTSALDLSTDSISLNVDTTLSYGNSLRVQTADDSAIGIANGGTANSVNADNGNLNYGQGSFSSIGRFVTEIDGSYKNMGIFVRANGFYDQRAGDTDRTRLNSKAERLVKDNINLLDAYAWADFNVGNMPMSVRVGEQVLSWGESTFIQNGINVINPFDVSKLRTPGSEIRDALRPVGMVTVFAAPTNNLTVEGFYQYDWERTLVEPAGSIFATNDFATDGANQLFLGFGAVSDQGTPFTPAQVAAINAGAAFFTGIPGFEAVDPDGLEEDFLAVSRASDNRPGNGGEFGFSLRYFSEYLNDTEFGFYFINHHSRVPVISAVTGTQAARDIALAVAAVDARVATHQYTQSARYVLEYPEDVQRLGISFNTDLARTGIALQGEYTFTNDAPLQIDDVEVLYAALCPLGALSPGSAFNQLDPLCAKYGSAFSTKIPGFIERNISQFQITASKFFGPTLQADEAVLVAETGVTYVHGMPKKSDLRLESAATFISGNAGIAAADPNHPGFESADAFADATSWGYRIAGRLTYNNAMGAVNVSPRFAWSHDVSGNTPGPGGNFLEDRKAITLGVGFEYQRTWQADLAYTNFFGAGDYNLLRDRDFTAFNIKYLF